MPSAQLWSFVISFGQYFSVVIKLKRWRLLEEFDQRRLNIPGGQGRSLFSSTSLSMMWASSRGQEQLAGSLTNPWTCLWALSPHVVPLRTIAGRCGVMWCDVAYFSVFAPLLRVFQLCLMKREVLKFPSWTGNPSEHVLLCWIGFPDLQYSLALSVIFNRGFSNLFQRKTPWIVYFYLK